jgi:hypothetical protein
LVCRRPAETVSLQRRQICYRWGTPAYWSLVPRSSMFMQGPVAIILISWNVIFIWETGYWTRAMKRFALFDLLKSLYSDTKILSKYIPSLQKNTICRRSWYIAAHVWKIYDYKIEVVPLIISFSTELTTVVKFEKVYIPIPRSCRNIFRLCRKNYKRCIFI